MNGISLAALLGAATWFGPKLSSPDTQDASAEAAPVPPTPDAGEIPAEAQEFFWPPNPLFQ